MAAASYTTDLQEFGNNQASATPWSEPSGFTSTDGSGEVDSDLSIYGTTCITEAQRKSGSGGLFYTTTEPGDFVDGTDCIFGWFKFFAPNATGTKTSGSGIEMFAGSSSSNFNRYYIAGSDTYAYGGWRNFVVNPNTTAVTPSNTTGSPNGTHNGAGFGATLSYGIAKGNSYNIDILRYGRGEVIVTDGDLANGYANFDDLAVVNDNPTTGRWGLFQDQGGSFLWKGLLTLGTAGTAVDFRASNRTITVDNTEFVQSDFNKIEINNASSNVAWSNINFNSLSTVSPGNFEVVNNGTVTTSTCNFTDMGTFIFGSNSALTSVSFRRCGAVTGNGASFTRVAAQNNGTFTVSDLSQLSLCTFTRDDAQSVHAVELTSLGSGTMTWTCTADDGYAAGTADTFTPANDAGLDASIFVNVASGNLTINIGTGGTVPSIRTAGATVTVQQAVDFTITNIIPGSEVRLYDSGLNELGAGQSGIVGATFTATPFNTNTQGANPTGIAVDGTFAYVIAGNTGNLYKYNYAGTLQTSWSVDATPAGVAYFNNTVYVVGGVGSSVVAYSTTGTPTGFSFSTAGQIVQESGLCFDGTHFYIADRNTDRVYRYTSAGVYDNFFFSVAAQDTEPRGIEVVGDFIFVNGFTNDKAFKYTKAGTYTGVSWDLSGQTDFCAGLSYDGTYFWSTGNDNRNVFYYTPTISSSTPGIEEIGITTPGLGWTVTPEGSPATRYSATYSYSYSADQDISIVIFDVDYIPLRLTDTLGSTSRSIKVEQQFDRNYDEGGTPFVNP